MTTGPSQPSHPSAPAGASKRHPRGLATLFFTEMWERFSYYGMRALLVLFMVDAINTGGMGMTDEVATAIYGLYTAAVYLACLPGGWLADRILGAQKSVWLGGIIIAAGHFTLAIPRSEAFYLGLILVVAGTGLLKPNISAVVGDLYPEGGARRDAGFTIFYMGINLGAMLGPVVCSTLGENYNWHYGFAAAGVGMVFGLIQFKLTAGWLGEAGKKPGHAEALGPQGRSLLWLSGAAAAAVIGLCLAGVIRIEPVSLARNTTSVIVAVAVLYFGYILAFYGLNSTEKKHVGVIIILFVGAAMFWAGFEQAGSSLNLFAERSTERFLDWIQFEIPAGWFQSLNAFFIIALAPVVAGLWGLLAKRALEPSLPVKFGLGLILLGGGFLIMAGASKIVAGGDKVWPTWLITTYLLHSVGELCLSPVGLSSVTKLAPKPLVGQMMGTWFLASSLGSLIAGLLAGEFKQDEIDQWPRLYLQIFLTSAGAGLMLFVFKGPIKKWMTGVK